MNKDWQYGGYGRFIFIRLTPPPDDPAPRPRPLRPRPLFKARPRRGGRHGGAPRPLVRGPALDLRLVVSEVRDTNGALLATWLLLTNLPGSVPAERVALWYYWRWRVESYFKLLKGAGLQVEHW